MINFAPLDQTLVSSALHFYSLNNDGGANQTRSRASDLGILVRDGMAAVCIFPAKPAIHAITSHDGPDGHALRIKTAGTIITIPLQDITIDGEFLEVVIGERGRLKEQAELLLSAIRRHRDQHGDDRCWLDDNELYAALPEGISEADTRLPPPNEMLKHCERYCHSRHDPGKPYVSPQRLIERHEADWNELRGYAAERAEQARPHASLWTTVVDMIDSLERDRNAEVPQPAGPARPAVESSASGDQFKKLDAKDQYLVAQAISVILRDESHIAGPARERAIELKNLIEKNLAAVCIFPASPPPPSPDILTGDGHHVYRDVVFYPDFNEAIITGPNGFRVKVKHPTEAKARAEQIARFLTESGGGSPSHSQPPHRTIFPGILAARVCDALPSLSADDCEKVYVAIQEAMAG